MQWQVRRAQSEDADRLALVGACTFLETFAGVLDGSAIIAHCQKEHSQDAYVRYLEANSIAWLAECVPGGAPVGFALLGSSSLPGSSADGSDLELKRIYALSRFHGAGVGAALMQSAVEYAKSRQAQRLLLGVYAGNERAIAFYRKQGFEPIAKRLFRVGSRDYDDIVFAKVLNGNQTI
jgi:ribosomal protein S18 acetylase RimI-like enzyme